VYWPPEVPKELTIDAFLTMRIKDRAASLGDENDIRHDTLESLEGSGYGHVVKVLKRQRVK
jgi:hypothetical protein